MSELSKLPNVGKVLEKLLNEVGITTAEELLELGTEEVFVRIRMKDPTACVHMLYGIEGAVEGVQDKFLTDETKEKLKAFYRSL